VADSHSERVWYAAYGSNLLAERFHQYLVGGTYGAAAGQHAGARDPALPRQSRVIEVPHQLRFGRESTRWGGGVAFLDPVQGSGRALLRCWDVTAQQFSDVAAQENGLAPGDLEVDVARVVEAGAVEVADRWYGRAVALGELDGRPVVTFTCSEVPDASAPGQPYLEVIVGGLLESVALATEAVADYLHACPGVADAWSLDRLALLARQSQH
jgi:hypothetical protein